MKKIILIIAIMLLSFSCSNNDCSEEKQSLNDYYDKQVQQVKDNGVNNPLGIDYRQIGLLENERTRKLAAACN